VWLLLVVSDSLFTGSRPDAYLLHRPAVIAIMGHKDHGKTTLLDKLRGANMAQKEEFGITQETYAFNVEVDPPPGVRLGKLVTLPAPKENSSSSSGSSSSSSAVRVPFSFLDTPGHVSFGEMRSTVGSLCDAILLVVAADEGVLDQTFETLRLARNLGRPLIVAINKMDLPGARDKADRIRKELVDMGATLHPPDKPKTSNKGDIVVLELSALHDDTKHDGQGFQSLKQALLLLCQQLPLQYDAFAPPVGAVVESMVHPGRGNLVRVLLQQGVLDRGDHFVAEGVFEGRVKDIRAMEGAPRVPQDAVTRPLRESEDDGEHTRDREKADDLSLASVGAGWTVDVMGCVALPNPGAPFVVCSSKEQAHLSALVARNKMQYRDQLREGQFMPPDMLAAAAKDSAEVAEAKERTARALRTAAEQSMQQEYQDALADAREQGIDVDAALAEVEAEGQFDEEETVEEDIEEDDGDDNIPVHADDVPVDLDPRSRVAPPLPPRSEWELSAPPPPTRRALPIAHLRPAFKFYTLELEQPVAGADEDAQARNAGANVQQPQQDASGTRKFGLNIILKTQNMGALRMVRLTYIHARTREWQL